MLKLKYIVKNYAVGEQTVRALKGVSLDFRQNEFVSILGPSGCGKTTLMNIVGGLDRATSGDMILNGVSTKDFRDNDWDDYRNKSIGFVFQSYNLISHLTVLGNVELALTIMGLKGDERRERAKQALDRVGLSDQYNKRPNQLSGGQMQRVAIARAIVNSPDILLADEPTGAIDSETSMQIMDILKEISREKLVIVVTHNNELAEQYSTRIVKILDGEITSDSNPYYAPDFAGYVPAAEPAVFGLNAAPYAIETEKLSETEKAAVAEEIIKAEGEAAAENAAAEQIAAEEKAEPAKQAKKRKKGTTMSFGTSVKLSFTNLINKRGRTALTAFAGSIAIISIALILAVNNGFSNYIANYEKQAMSKYPITASMGEDSILTMFQDILGNGMLDSDTINIDSIFSLFSDDENDMKKFTKEKLIYIYSMFAELLKSRSGVNKTNDISVFKNYVEDNFDYSLATVKYDYSLNLDIYAYNDTYSKDPKYFQVNPLFEQMGAGLEIMLGGMDVDSSMMGAMKNVINSFAVWDEIVGDNATIDNQYDMLWGNLPRNMNEVVLVVNEYNQIDDLMLYAIGEITLADLAGGSGYDDAIPFDEFKGKEFYVLPNTSRYTKVGNSYVDVATIGKLGETLENEAVKIKISGIVRPKAGVDGGCINGVIGYSNELSKYIMDKVANSQFVVDQKKSYTDYLAAQEVLAEIIAAFQEEYGSVVGEQVSLEDIKSYLSPQDQMRFAVAYATKIKNLATGSTMSVSEYNTFLRELNLRDYDKPSTIYFYPNSIKTKDNIVAFLENFNEKMKAEAEAKDETDPTINMNYVVTVSDELDSIIASMSTVVDTIIYILIAVALVSVIVTMLLIAIIMYISVQDRIREIGILRSLGARKLDIASIFNVETMLLGLASGIVGVIIALILNFPVNLICKVTLGISNLLQPAWWHSLVLIVGSVVITLISGLIPSTIAAKKDPVIALRTD